ncbi:hypothetical protein ACVWW5_004957 [Bradyrhizobium sp. LM3.4]
MKASCGVYVISSRNSWLPQPRPFLRQPFQHRRDHVDVDSVLDLHTIIANGRLIVSDVVGREPRRCGLDLEFSVEHVGVVERCGLVAGLRCSCVDHIDLAIDRGELYRLERRGLRTHGIEIDRARLLRARRAGRRCLEPGRAAVVVIVRLKIVPVDAAMVGGLDASASAGEPIDDAGEDAGKCQRAADREQQHLE